MLEDVLLSPANGGKARRAVIILHGLGDSASGIMGLGEALRGAFPDTLFIAPNAPFPCDFAPFGYQWFSMQDMSQTAILKGVANAAAPLNSYIDHVLETHTLQPENVALLGFSQGTMMSLYVAPRRAEPLAGVLGYSGALIGGETLGHECKSKLPIMLIHGTHDDVVPFQAMEHAVIGLQRAGLEADSLACPGLTHSIDDQGLSQGARFLRRAFKL